MNILKVLLVVIILGVILFLIYKKLIAPVSSVAVINSSPPMPALTGPQIRVVGDANYCGWLNGTYPKLKTRQFSDIDGARDNPQALADWQKNNCDLINY